MATMPNALGMQVPIGTPALGGGSTATNIGATQTVGAVPTSIGGMAPATMAQNNVYAAPASTSPPVGGVPTLGPGGQGVSAGAPTTQGSGVNWTDGSNTVTGDFKDTYGAGTGTAITNVLSSLGTTNNAAIQAMINQTNTAANQQYGNIQSQEAAAGITPNSSTAALASGDFYSQVNQGLQTNISQMEQQQQNTLLQTLLGEGAAHGGDPTLMNSIMGGFSDAATIAGDTAKIAGAVGAL